MKVNKKNYLEGIEVLRGIAVLLILGIHTMMVFYPDFLYESVDYRANGWLDVSNFKRLLLNFNPFGKAWFGLAIFFTISGFIIHYQFLKSDKKSLRVSRFLSKRFWRIYPPYFVALLIFFSLNSTFSYEGIKDLSFHLFLIHIFSKETYFSINGCYWSISVEFMFYLLYPLLLLIIRKISIKNFAIALTIFALLCELSNLEFLYYPKLWVGYWLNWIIGAFLAEKFVKGERLSKKPLLVFVILYSLHYLLDFNQYTLGLSRFAGMIAAVFLIDHFLYVDLSKNKIGYKSSRFFIFIGTISYSIYLLHQPFLHIFIPAFWQDISYYLALIISVFVSWLIIILLAYSFFNLIEMKSSNFKRILSVKGRIRSFSTFRFFSRIKVNNS